MVDEAYNQLLREVRKHKATRVFMDGLSGIRVGMFNSTRMQSATTALANELRAYNVTTLFTEELELFPTQTISSPVSDLSAVTDNILFIRQLELDSTLRRFISILKTRESSADRRIHEVTIDSKGLNIGQAFKGVEGLFTGQPRKKGGAKRKR